MLLAGFFIAKFGGLMLLLGFVLASLPSDELGQGWADAAELHPLVELCCWVLLIRYAIDFLWFTIVKGDSLEITVLPEEPRLSQLTEYLGASINGRGFIPLQGRIESESPSR